MRIIRTLMIGMNLAEIFINSFSITLESTARLYHHRRLYYVSYRYFSIIRGKIFISYFKITSWMINNAATPSNTQPNTSLTAWDFIRPAIRREPNWLPSSLNFLVFSNHSGCQGGISFLSPRGGNRFLVEEIHGLADFGQ